MHKYQHVTDNAVHKYLDYIVCNVLRYMPLFISDSNSSLMSVLFMSLQFHLYRANNSRLKVFIYPFIHPEATVEYRGLQGQQRDMHHCLQRCSHASNLLLSYMTEGEST